ncbi:MAG: peptidylprolyl isomerase [Parvularculaceae bacterium]
MGANAPARAQSAPAEDRTGVPESYIGPVSAIAAIVNDNVITTFDVEQRVNLMIMASGGQLNPQILPQLQNKALQDLVQELLKMQEAHEFELAPDEGEVETEVRSLAAQNGLSFEQLKDELEKNGVSIATLRKQMAANIVWPRLVQGRYGKRVRVRDQEVDATLERLREEATQEQYLLSEICIPVPSPEQAQAYYDGGMQLIEQMRKGVPFAVVAQQFSACTTAATGGDMGWVRAGELPDEISQAITELPPGSVTNPIPSEGAFMIMAVRDKREAVKQGEKTWTLAYAGAPLSVGRAAARQDIEKLATSQPCGGGALRQDLGPDVGPALLENVTLSDIDPRFHSVIENLATGELSAIVEADDTLHVAYACTVDEGLGIPSREAIENRLYSRQLERISQQYLRDVERKATVDIRLRTQGAPVARNG